MIYSIIVPCYNEGPNIADLIDMLTHCQTNYDIQWIMVENGSKDNTRAELEFYCANKPNFCIAYVDENRGYGYGIQQGLKMAIGDYIGWLHADMQIRPTEMIRFIEIAEAQKTVKFFFKGKRKNRSMLDKFFTSCMTLFASAVLGIWIYDIGAIPVLFHRSLLNTLSQIPYDFSIETYVYAQAKKLGMHVYRQDVYQYGRKRGESSWNKGFSSKIRQSKIIMRDIILIRKGIQVR